MAINDLNSVRIISMAFLLLMAGEYGAVAGICLYRISQGRNGVTPSLLFNSLALMGLAVAIFFYILLPLPEGVVMSALLAVVITNAFLILSLWAEKNKPFKRQTRTRERLFRPLEKELPNEKPD
jgi:hypothetical protein